MKKIFIIIILTVLHAGSSAQNVNEDIQLGNEAYAEVVSSMGLYKNEEMQTYLNKLGQRLISELSSPLFKFDFYVVDSPEPNAFSVPGGKVFITRGLMMLPLTEDELAGVVSHEIIHTQKRHWARQQQKGWLGAIVALPGLLLSGIFQGPVGQVLSAPFIGGGLLIVAQYSQNNETESDREGATLAAAAGYDPAALATILARMKKTTDHLSGKKETKSYFSTHPYTPDRVRNIQKLTSKISFNNHPPIKKQAEFLDLLNGMPVNNNPEFGFVQGKTIYHATTALRVDTLKDWEYSFSNDGISFISNKEDAAVLIVSNKDSVKATELLSDMEKKLNSTALINPISTGKVKWQQYEGGMFEYSYTSQGKPVIIQMYAIDYDGKLLKIFVLCFEEKKNETYKIIGTLKPLMRSQIPDAEYKVLVTSNALEKETMTDFNLRMGASSNLTLNCIINDKKETDSCYKGELIKWIASKKYSFKNTVPTQNAEIQNPWIVRSH